MIEFDLNHDHIKVSYNDLVNVGSRNYRYQVANLPTNYPWRHVLKAIHRQWRTRRMPLASPVETS
ncbi:MAG: hypothetical protein AAF629_26980 [Chloroflexota bacterium]